MRYAIWIIGTGYYKNAVGIIPTWDSPEDCSRALIELGFVKEGNATVMPYRSLPFWARIGLEGT